MNKPINEVTIEGKVFNYKTHPMLMSDSMVGEGVLEVPSWKAVRGLGNLYYDFPIRWYGKSARRLDEVKEGTRVIVKGSLTEDLRVNTSKPDTMRSKIYIDIKSVKIVEE